MPLLEAPVWTLDVERGPDWLFLRVHAPEAGLSAENGLADLVWHTMQQHLARRVVLEFDALERLSSYVIGQLVLLHKKIHAAGGTLRLCGLSEANQQSLRIARLSEFLPVYATRSEAVMGPRPKQPR
jgi:anti-anti-sigma factor